MSLKDTEGRRYYSDEAVENRMGISASKMRTAQRVELVESVSALVHARHVRVWSESMVLQVYIANVMADHLAIPFQAACTVLKAAREEHPESVALHELYNERKLPGPKDGGGKGAFPLVVITDKCFVHVVRDGKKHPLGLVKSGDDGRSYFAPDPKIKIPRDGEAVSNCCVDILTLMRNFTALVDDA